MNYKFVNRILPIIGCLLLASFVQGQNQNSTQNPCANLSVGIGASLNGFVPFPPSSPWNRNIANAPLDPNSSAIISFIGSSVVLHPDFGAGLWQGQLIGIPYIVVPATQANVNINYTLYGAESDPGPMPIPANAPVQGGNDRHVIVIDKGNCWSYDLYRGYLQNNGSWNADGGAAWDLTANEQRPYLWTSSNAAGTSEFAGLVRYDEVAAGAINHALEFTLRYTKEAFTPPASHWAANSTNNLAAPMGMRMRLKAGYDISRFPREVQVILTALKKYGMIVVDNGAPMFLSGAPDPRWNNSNLHQMQQLTASDFEVVLSSPVYTRNNVPTGPKPSINSFTATSSSGPGQPVTLSWSVANGEYYAVNPTVGVLRDTSVVVNPTVTTTYTLYATNAYNRSTAQVTVVVP